MTRARLRSWIRKYGNWGVLLVASYLALLWIWLQRRRVLLVGTLGIALGGLSLCVPSKRPVLHAPVPVAPSSPALLSHRPAAEAQVIVCPETRVDSVVVPAGKDRWRVEIWRPRHTEDASGFRVETVVEYVKFFRNDRLIREATAEELGPGCSLDLGKILSINGIPVLTLRVEPEAGNPSAMVLFSVRHGRLVEKGRVGGEAGGPLLRDIDGDGKPEWIFDDYDFYNRDDSRPLYFLVYKEASDGTLRLWKRLPNKKRRRLPAALGLERWDM